MKPFYFHWSLLMLPSTIPRPFFPLLMLRCLVRSYNIQHVILEVIQARFFSWWCCVWRYYHIKLFRWTVFGMAIGLSTKKKNTSHTHMCGRNFCLPPLWSRHARAACALLNPILKERFTPHVWEALGIGREHTQRRMHKHNLHAWCNVQSLEQTDTLWYMKQHCSVLLLVKWYLHTCSVPLHRSFTVYNTGRGSLSLICYIAELLWVLPHFDFFFPFPIALRRPMYDSRSFPDEGPSKAKVLREKRWRSEREGYRGIDEGMKEGCGPVRHLELWCYWEIWCVCIWNPTG